MRLVSRRRINRVQHRSELEMHRRPVGLLSLGDRYYSGEAVVPRRRKRPLELPQEVQ